MINIIYEVCYVDIILDKCVSEPGHSGMLLYFII